MLKQRNIAILACTAAFIGYGTAHAQTPPVTGDPAAGQTAPVAPGAGQTAPAVMPDSAAGSPPSNALTDTRFDGVVVPEGFERQSALVTAAELMGADIYDREGASIGKVADLVIGMDVAQSGGADRESTHGLTKTESIPDQQSGAAPDAAAQTAAETAADRQTDAVTPTLDTSNTATAAQGTGTTTPAQNTTTADGATAAQGTEGMTPNASVTQSGTEVTPPAADAAQGGAAGEGRLSHAVIDIGGFLGLGGHTTAIPVEDLAIFRSSSETRVYVALTREELEALPVFNKDDPATLGRSMVGSN